MTPSFTDLYDTITGWLMLALAVIVAAIFGAFCIAVVWFVAPTMVLGFIPAAMLSAYLAH